jgi:hypothetical protein
MPVAEMLRLLIVAGVRGSRTERPVAYNRLHNRFVGSPDGLTTYADNVVVLWE